MGGKMISIVIPNYNGNNYLKRCIEAIRNIDNTRIQIIVIDNGSIDNDYEWLSEYQEVAFYRLDKNYGFSRAVNEGIKIAQGEYVILLNNDTEVCTGFIEKLVNCISKDRDVFAVCSQMIQYYNKNLIDDAGDEYNLLGWTLKRGDGQPMESQSKQKDVFSSCAGAAIYRKSVFEKIGYFDENFFAYMEDVDISYRARIHGYKNIYCPDAKVYHIGSGTSGSKYNAFKVKLSARNNIYVPYKNMPFLQLIINIPFLLVGFLIKYLFFVKKGFGKEYREGVVEAFKTIHKVEKVKFKWVHIPNYIKIEYLLIKNTFSYIYTTLRIQGGKI